MAVTGPGPQTCLDCGPNRVRPLPPKWTMQGKHRGGWICQGKRVQGHNPGTMNDAPMPWRGRLRECARQLKRNGVALWFAVRDPRTPLLPKLLCGIVVAYALSPIDLIPDFIPVLGYLDDVLLLPGLIWLAIRTMPEHLMEDCRMKADQWMQVGGAKPRSLVGAAVIILVWVAVAGGLWVLWAP
jgi:uncharacterized membrane protein YkvA (DUF1232 family)